MPQNWNDPWGLENYNAPRELYPLRSWKESSEADFEETGEDINTESDVALFHEHYEQEEINKVSFRVIYSGFLQKILSYMSGTPLIGPSQAQSVGSYGALPADDFNSSGDVSQESLDTVDDVRRRDRRKGKESISKTFRRAKSSSPSLPKDFAPKSRSGRAPSVSESESLFARGHEILGEGSRKLFEGFNSTINSETKSSKESSNSGDEVVDVEDRLRQNHDDPPDNSSYAQVRASVPATDNRALSISTPRMWTLSSLFVLLGSAANLFFSLRYPSVAVGPLIALILVHPLGRVWDALLKCDDDPEELFEDGILVKRLRLDGPISIPISSLQSLRLWLAQGRWNEKEHCLVYISASITFGFAFATDVIVEQKMFYNQKDLNIIYQLLLTLSTQILGYGFAGLTRRYLVSPPSMTWPGTLASTAMFTTLHKSENHIANGWTISRWRFFSYVWTGAFAWYFLPGLLMPALSYFSVITWLAPDNVVIANLFGVSSGLGLFPMTFDWAQIAYIGSPLLTPFWAAANVAGGLIIIMWIIAPVLYYTNTLYASFMPILSSSVFDDTGSVYNLTRILTPDLLFDREAYESYSRVYLPIVYVLSYGVQFAALSSLITHTACFHGSDLWRQTKRSFGETSNATKAEYQPVDSDLMSDAGYAGRNDTNSGRYARHNDIRGDVHNRLMQRYKDAPMSWYMLTLVVCLAGGIAVVEVYPVQLPWWGLLLALAITSVLFIPVGIIMAITNQHSSLYLICQLIAGYIWPGKGLANMVFVTFCYISSAQGVKFSSDLKLGHYMKIPPRLLFKVQMIATVISSVTQVGVLNWMFVHVAGICTQEAVNGFSCPFARVHFNGSILWGVVGPRHFFGNGALYRNLIWAFPVGAIAPILVWQMSRRYPSSFWRKVNLPVMFGSLGWIPPATGLNFSIWAFVCLIFNYSIRRRAPAWWGKYTMTMSAALDSGLAFSLIVVFFLFIFPSWRWVDDLHYWGTDIYKQGCDWKACSYLSVAPGEHFGPSRT